MLRLTRIRPYQIFIVTSVFLVGTANLTFFRTLLALYPFAENDGFIITATLLLIACLTLLMATFSYILP